MHVLQLFWLNKSISPNLFIRSPPVLITKNNECWEIEDWNSYNKSLKSLLNYSFSTPPVLLSIFILMCFYNFLLFVQNTKDTHIVKRFQHKTQKINTWWNWHVKLIQLRKKSSGGGLLGLRPKKHAWTWSIHDSTSDPKFEEGHGFWSPHRYRK